jgi:hypothetical protein
LGRKRRVDLQIDDATLEDSSDQIDGQTRGESVRRGGRLNIRRGGSLKEDRLLRDAPDLNWYGSFGIGNGRVC